MMIKITTTECKRCHYKWIPRVPQPLVCPACHSRYWNVAKRAKATEKQEPVSIEEKANVEV